MLEAHIIVALGMPLFHLIMDDSQFVNRHPVRWGSPEPWEDWRRCSGGQVRSMQGSSKTVIASELHDSRRLPRLRD